MPKKIEAGEGGDVRVSDWTTEEFARQMREVTIREIERERKKGGSMEGKNITV